MTTALALSPVHPATRHGLTYGQWLGHAGHPRGGKRLHAAWWRGDPPRAYKAKENPIGGVSAAVVALVAAAIGGVATFFVSRYLEKKSAISDPIFIAQAQVNMSNLSANAASITPNTPPIPPNYHSTPATIGTITPDFTAALQALQAWVNANGQTSVLNSLQGGQGAAAQIAAALPPLPLRTDGVLDPDTFDWLTIVVNA